MLNLVRRSGKNADSQTHILHVEENRAVSNYHIYVIFLGGSNRRQQYL